MEIPFLDLKAQYATIRDEVQAGIQQVMQQTAFAGGPFVEAFEADFARYCQTKYAAGVSNGTAALWLALAALEIGPGDDVITVPNTFIATAEAISFAGARPVFVDVDPQTYTMDPAALEAAITPNTRAVIPVHLFGQMADMRPIMQIARKHDLYVIEDAAQAHGATYQGQRAGSIGDVGCFSFYPGKNLGAYGEAGGVVTNDRDIAERVRMLRDHGQSQKYHHRLVGWNARMDGIQGAVLSVKLKYIDEWNELRRAHAGEYDRRLEALPGVVTPAMAPYGTHVYHIYAIRTRHRDEVIAALKERGVHCGIHYPLPLHLQEAYRHLDYRQGDFPVSEACCAEYVSLPMFPEMTPGHIDYVVENLAQVVRLHAVNGSAPAYRKNTIVS